MPPPLSQNPQEACMSHSHISSLPSDTDMRRILKHACKKPPQHPVGSSLSKIVSLRQVAPSSSCSLSILQKTFAQQMALSPTSLPDTSPDALSVNIAYDADNVQDQC